MLQILELHCDSIMTLLPEVTTFMNNHLRPFFVTKSVLTTGAPISWNPHHLWFAGFRGPWCMSSIITTIVNHLLVKAGTRHGARADIVLTKFKFLNFPVPGVLAPSLGPSHDTEEHYHRHHCHWLLDWSEMCNKIMIVSRLIDGVRWWVMWCDV